MKKWFLVIFVLVLAVVSYTMWDRFAREPKGPIVNSFEECGAAGYPIMESYPRQCRDSAGTLFVEQIAPAEDTEAASFVTNNGEEDMIRVTAPRAGETIASPLVIRGEARGNWFFEASFPITLTDWEGRIIASHYATAEGEWMTTEYVPFEAIIEFDSPEDIGEFSRYGTLTLHKDNASGLPEHDDALEIAVVFQSDN